MEGGHFSMEGVGVAFIPEPIGICGADSVMKVSMLTNPSNARATFVQRTMMQRFLKTI